MSSASRVAHTTDILYIIFSHLSAGNDLTSLLRTSPLFFGGPYGKTELLELVQTVVVERAPLPVNHPVWAEGYEPPPPFPAVETVIIHPADRNARQHGGIDETLPDNALIERLCPTATRLHVSTLWLTPGARGGRSMPSLPCVETLVLKANVGEFTQLRYPVGGVWGIGRNVRPPCLNIKAVHILLWGDLVYPEEKFRSSIWDKDCVEERAIRWLSLLTNAILKDKRFHDLCKICEELGMRGSIDELWLYNADTMLERLKVLGMPEEAAETQVFWRTGLEFYEAFGDMLVRDETEEWYHSAVLAPSSELVSLRARLAAKTKYPADTFVGLTEREAEWTLSTFQFERMHK
ncbi:hypothetical protein L202_08174 [Cryptococcus amylolentus CBS 6039]|uniref:Uncharacterized protein n=1 Tax=Cryptococcus amylolentus CBS 6039 TaxID=1295533 RepID=A0A1E3HAF0_9TREE|nr:hypothetical protein L202_08174 [Cryptococcus amylolentus CBS 6039]ODN72736.1 hypothetical protein L202_08174 [Cryptococcus amylolentus CBS 6039]